ncbi:hypothetical protein GGX14DRAFT_569781 [Mycena pura]|uniref:Uncharacterized protein n=1 Tax=Mycena pura TaxID=153505 RepID=A0AAD6V938_9AGAR|nr:hypothetical protein GGX14DRAFT_569781 [Mycena pura]
MTLTMRACRAPQLWLRALKAFKRWLPMPANVTFIQCWCYSSIYQMCWTRHIDDGAHVRERAGDDDVFADHDGAGTLRLLPACPSDVVSALVSPEELGATLRPGSHGNGGGSEEMTIKEQLAHGTDANAEGSGVKEAAMKPA